MPAAVALTTSAGRKTLSNTSLILTYAKQTHRSYWAKIWKTDRNRAISKSGERQKHLLVMSL